MAVGCIRVYLKSEQVLHEEVDFDRCIQTDAAIITQSLQGVSVYKKVSFFLFFASLCNPMSMRVGAVLQMVLCRVQSWLGRLKKNINIYIYMADM